MINTDIIDELERNGNVIHSLLVGLNADVVEWRPAPDKWNLLEITCHLVDEEIEDFRARVQSILEDPKNELIAIDPQGWVAARKYIDRDFNDSLNLFVDERKKSIEWLSSLQNPKWDNAFEHPKVRPVTAQLILENCLAHDILHLRQILGVKYKYLKSNIQNPLDYAGDW